MHDGGWVLAAIDHRFELGPDSNACHFLRNIVMLGQAQEDAIQDPHASRAACRDVGSQQTAGPGREGGEERVRGAGGREQDFSNS